jgi:GcrA cell cycle regulator
MRPDWFPWTDEIIEKAKGLIKSGMTAQQVADAIGAPSRKAVIGKMYRLGLPGGGQGKIIVRRPASEKPRVWTTELTQRAASLFEKGHSHSEIADILGMSKNAVSRYMQRIGLITDRSASQRASWQHRSTRKGQQKADPAPMPQRIIAASDADVPLPESRRVSLVALKPGLCKWPLGDPQSPDFCFCGADTHLLTLSYCPSHRLLARGNGTPSERRAVQDAKAVAA